MAPLFFVILPTRYQKLIIQICHTKLKKLKELVPSLVISSVTLIYRLLTTCCVAVVIKKVAKEYLPKPVLVRSTYLSG